MGTPNYMSPEQAAGQVASVDHRTDQWSLACIAYEMLSGRGPFLGETIHSLLFQVVNQEPPKLTSLNPRLPPEIEKVVARGMSKAKADRFPTINAFARAFVAAATGGTVSSAAIATAPTEASVPARRRQQPAPAPAPQSPLPQPTTLSRTASEMVSTLSKLKAGLRSKWGIVGGAALLAIVAVVVLGPGSRPPPRQASATARRLNVAVRSVPPGADIFVGEAQKAIGTTPVTIPVDLTGVDSVRLRLKKVGYEDHDQIVVDDAPVAVRMVAIAVVAPIEPPPVVTPPSVAAPPEPAQPRAPATDEPAKPKRAAAARPAKPATPTPPKSPAAPAKTSRRSILEEL